MQKKILQIILTVIITAALSSAIMVRPKKDVNTRLKRNKAFENKTITTTQRTEEASSTIKYKHILRGKKEQRTTTPSYGVPVIRITTQRFSRPLQVTFDFGSRNSPKKSFQRHYHNRSRPTFIRPNNNDEEKQVIKGTSLEKPETENLRKLDFNSSMFKQRGNWHPAKYAKSDRAAVPLSLLSLSKLPLQKKTLDKTENETIIPYSTPFIDLGESSPELSSFSDDNSSQSFNSQPHNVEITHEYQTVDNTSTSILPLSYFLASSTILPPSDTATESSIVTYSPTYSSVKEKTVLLVEAKNDSHISLLEGLLQDSKVNSSLDSSLNNTIITTSSPSVILPSYNETSSTDVPPLHVGIKNITSFLDFSEHFKSAPISPARVASLRPNPSGHLSLPGNGNGVGGNNFGNLFGQDFLGLNGLGNLGLNAGNGYNFGLGLGGLGFNLGQVPSSPHSSQNNPLLGGLGNIDYLSLLGGNNANFDANKQTGQSLPVPSFRIPNQKSNFGDLGLSSLFPSLHGLNEAVQLPSSQGLENFPGLRNLGGNPLDGGSSASLSIQNLLGISHPSNSQYQSALPALSAQQPTTSISEKLGIVLPSVQPTAGNVQEVAAAA